MSNNKPANCLKNAANIGAILMFSVAGVAFALFSLSQLMNSMLPLPIVLSGLLLVIALICGVRRGVYFGFVLVLAFGVIAGFTVSIGAGAGGGPLAAALQKILGMIPWLFVGVCALAAFVNGRA